MSKTLFWYIFKDLLKVFLLTSGALAGILSFGGLLQPMAKHGLDATQMVQMLSYFMPAMTNYSWPVAALFATTFVYGRLAADNELLAMRATGMGWLHILFPAFLLAFILACASLAMMLYVVPRSLQSAEKVIYSNLAKLVANEIDRRQRIEFEATNTTILARSAGVLPEDPANPRQQAVQLNDIAIVRYSNKDKQGEPKKPEDFYLAQHAVAFITMPSTEEGEVMVSVRMRNGARYPVGTRESGRDQVRAMISENDIMPFPLLSQMKETARYMTIDRLLDLRMHPEKSRRVSRLLKNFIQTDQERSFLSSIRQKLLDGVPVEYQTDNGFYRITAPRGQTQVGTDRLIATAGTADNPLLKVEQIGGEGPFEALARQLTFTAFPNNDSGRMTLGIDMTDAILFGAQQSSARQSVNRKLNLPMPQEIKAITQKTVADYANNTSGLMSANSRERLLGAKQRQMNHVEAELHVRFSFALSCLVLVVVGAIIGMLFRSGNFVSAFAISTIPAILSLMLIMTGQHMAENVPEQLVPGKFQNPLETGLLTIWSGNLMVIVIGAYLFLFRLNRT
jgi:lipopolysaccharide export system permease protein